MTLLFLKYSCQHCITGKKRTLTEMTIRCQSLSLVVTSCHLLYNSLSLVCLFINDPRKTSKDQKIRTLTFSLQKECSGEIENVQGICGILHQQI